MRNENLMYFLLFRINARAIPESS